MRTKKMRSKLIWGQNYPKIKVVEDKKNEIKVGLRAKLAKDQSCWGQKKMRSKLVWGQKKSGSRLPGQNFQGKVEYNHLNYINGF